MSVIETIESQIRRLETLREYAVKLDDCPFPASEVCNEIMIEISELEQLSEIRAFLRERLGGWTDRVHVWASGNNGIAEWKDRVAPVKIWFRCPVATFPRELLKDGCEFVPVKSAEHRLVCGLEER